MHPDTPNPFVVGQIYNRRLDIHGRYGGQQQGGMSTPKHFPLLFLFTGDAGHAHGYRDAFRADGVFCYTGEGQQGDMAMTGSNRALRDHAALGKTVHLFEASKSTGVGRTRYVGQATYLGHHLEQRPNAAGVLRMVIVFELAVESTAPCPWGPLLLPNRVIRPPRLSRWTACPWRSCGSWPNKGLATARPLSNGWSWCSSARKPFAPTC